MFARIRHHWPCLSSQQGSLLVEVMVGALVLGITTLAVLSGLDGAQDTGRKNKDRSEYSALAQQDIERLRAKPITSLSNYSETRTVRVASVDYTVRSESEWVSDATGAVSCTDNSTQADYMKITSTVFSPAGKNNPVKETTLLTPAPGAFSATSGTAAVLLTDRDGNPLPGINVSLSGPGSFTDTTNALGCAIFGYIPSGDYTAQVSGGVTWASELPATAPVTVNAGRTTLTQIELEQPASLRAHFKTPGGVATQWSRISVAHAKLPAGFKNFPNATATTLVSSIDATNLFPHRDAYGVYAGSCEANDPGFWDSTYFKPGVNGYIQLDPGDNLRDVDVTMPIVRIVITKQAARPARATVTQIDGPDCTEKLVTPALNPNAAAPAGGTPATLAIPLPFGRYRLCVDDGTNRKTSSSFTANISTPQDQNLTPGQPLDVTDQVDMTSGTGRVAGVCP